MKHEASQLEGASVPDQALAVPVEPVARLDPTGVDPSRIYAWIEERYQDARTDRITGNRQGDEYSIAFATGVMLELLELRSWLRSEGFPAPEQSA